MRLFTQHDGPALRTAGSFGIGALAVAVAGLVVSPVLAAQTADSTHSARDAASPAPVTARDTTQSAPDTTGTTSNTQTHTVKKGDTLWDLARQYLNDPFLWPEIYRLNTETVQDPHWIYPGQVLKIPAGAQMVAEDEMAEPRLQPQTVTSAGGPTVFSQDVANHLLVTSRFGSSAAAYPHTVVRPGEFYAAPWVDRNGGPGGGGQIVAQADMPGIAEATERERVLPQDRVYITLPKGIVAARGDRLMAFAIGPEVEVGQVMIPTGILQIEKTDNGGEASTARVVEQFGDIELGQGVLPLSHFTMTPDQRPAPVTLGLEGKVVYVSDNAVLPSVQSYVIFDATAKDGVKIGDEFTLYRPRTKVDIQGISKPVVLPDEPIAVAQVVKVTDHGSTAIVLSQQQPVIKDGVYARMTARMP